MGRYVQGRCAGVVMELRQYSHGLYGPALYSYGLYGYGLYSYVQAWLLSCVDLAMALWSCPI